MCRRRCDQPTHLLAGWLVDGTGVATKERVLLTLCNGVITAVEEGVTGGLPMDSLVDLRQCTIIPALVDCHVHLCLSGERDPALRQTQGHLPFDQVQSVILRHLVEDLAHGIMAVRDAGDHAGHALAFKHRSMSAERLPVLMRCAGRAWHARGRYGRLLGGAPADGESLAEAVKRTSDEVDQLKVIQSGINSLSSFAQPTASQFPLEDLRAAISHAKSRGLPTMVHANGEQPVQEALIAGCRSIEHGYFMGVSNLEMMAERGIVWVPTVTPMAVLAKESSMSPLERDIAARTVDHQLEQLHRSNQMGVTVALGTDSGSYGVLHGRSVAEELCFLVDSGFSLESAVRSATANGAQLLGLAEEMGRVMPGFPASFIAVDGPPGDLMKNLAIAYRVWVRGEIFGEARQEQS